MKTRNYSRGWGRRLALTGGAVVFCALAACSGGSDSGPPTFGGINQDFIVAGGNRALSLKGRKGSYTAITYSGVNTLPVMLTSSVMTIGGLDLTYLFRGGIIQGSNFYGFARTGVSFDPTKMPGVYDTIFGANFAGQLSIASDGSYAWCAASNLPASGTVCPDSSNEDTGTITVKPTGFSFSGSRGTYAIYSQNSAAVIFGIDVKGLNITAMSVSNTPPHGAYFEASQMALNNSHRASANFSNDAVTFKALPNFSGSYSYTFSNGQISFPSPNCPGGTCNGIYNRNVGMMYLAQVGNFIFLP